MSQSSSAESLGSHRISERTEPKFEMDTVEMQKAFDNYIKLSPEIRQIVDIDLYEIFEITKDIASFDKERFSNILEICTDVIEKYSSDAKAGESNFRVQGYEVYLWLADTLTGMDFALKTNNELFLLENLHQVHKRIQSFVSEVQPDI